MDSPQPELPLGLSFRQMENLHGVEVECLKRLSALDQPSNSRFLQVGCSRVARDSGGIRLLRVLAGYRHFSAHAKAILHQLVANPLAIPTPESWSRHRLTEAIIHASAPSRAGTDLIGR